MPASYNLRRQAQCRGQRPASVPERRHEAGQPVHAGRHAGAADRHPGQGDRHVHLRAQHPGAGDAARPGRVAARAGQCTGRRDRCVSVDESSIKHIPGAQVVRRGNFVGVVAPNGVRRDPGGRPAEGEVGGSAGSCRVTATCSKQMREQDSAGQAPASVARVNTGNVDAALASAAHVVSATYTFPYNGHMPIGPACVRRRRDSRTARSSTPTRRTSTACARSWRRLLGLPENLIRLRYFEGVEHLRRRPRPLRGPEAAAVMSQLVGKPVRLQFMRWDEHG